MTLFKSFCDTVKSLCNSGVISKGDAQGDLESHRVEAVWCCWADKKPDKGDISTEKMIYQQIKNVSLY